MPPITRPTLAAVISELEAKGWQRNGKLRTKPPFTFHHPVKSKFAAVVQKMPSSKGLATFTANW